MVLVIAAGYSLERWQLDYNTTFVSTGLEEEVYEKKVPGYEECDVNGNSILVRLHKNLYILCQGQKFWWGKVDNCWTEIGWKSLESDSCVCNYSKSRNISTRHMSNLFVDHVSLLGEDLKALKKIQRELMAPCSMTDTKAVSVVLELGATHNHEKKMATITDGNPAKSLEQRGMANCNTPANTCEVGRELPLDQLAERLLKQGGQAVLQGYLGHRHIPPMCGSICHWVCR